MDKQTIYSIISLLIGLAGIVGATYAYIQVKLIRQERARRENVERELASWSVRAQDVGQKLVVMAPYYSHGGTAGVPQGQVYHIIVPDPALRGLVESYLIRMIPGTNNRAEARMLTPEMLGLGVVQDTIKRVEACFETARKDNPTIAARASLG